MNSRLPSSPVPSGYPAQPDGFESAAETLRAGRVLRHPRLREAASLIESARFAPATKLLREFLKERPRDANALHLLAEAATGQGRNDDAEELLARCLELAPDSATARFDYVNCLLRANRSMAALEQVGKLIERDRRNPLFRALQALALEGVEDHAAAAEIWRGLLAEYPARPEWWVRYGNVLRGLGRLDDCIAAYRAAAELGPSSGGAWWSLADLKTFRFGQAEIGRMETQLGNAGLAADNRTRLHFSLGKAYGDLKLYEKSFAHYSRGNAVHRLEIEHDPEVQTVYATRCKRVFTADFFRSRAGSGCGSMAPIFLVGMPRSGSTLVEQILASHSQIEGTKELADLAALSRRLQRLASREGSTYPGVLEGIDVATFAQLGEQYLENTRAHRKQGRRFFIDKMGPNFAHVGLLELILPNARIVDVRRHPLACCLSIFTQLFPKGQNDCYRLTDIGRSYRNYVELMAHFERELPGKVHRIFYESLVAEPETEIRRLLDYLGLPFDPACLRFHETERVVTTVSAEQVRRRLYRDALEHWRHYEPWLDPLKSALGPALDAWAGGPDRHEFDMQPRPNPSGPSHGS